jgi:CheY-specific phosphatase CheX
MNSCAPVQPLADPASVVQAVSNVAERSFFAFAETADAASVAALTPAGTRAMSASVRFVGPCAGEMRVTMPVALARELATLFSGDPELVFSEADLADMTGEFGNMVTGAWLTATDATSMFDLAAPVVTWVDAPPPVALMMHINGQPMGLSWSVE